MTTRKRAIEERSLTRHGLLLSTTHPLSPVASCPLLDRLPSHDVPSRLNRSWNYTDFGEGPASAEDHVVVETTFFDKLGPMGYQERNILQSEVYEHLTPT